jgi:hypothetical protein
MRVFLLGCTALLSTLALACDEESSPTSPAENVRPSLRATVTRTTEAFFRLEVDDATGLIAVFGLSQEDLAGLCAGQVVDFDQLRDVIVTRPDGSVKLTVQGRPRVTIYPPTANLTDLCQLTEVTPIATGTVHFSHLDNDVFLSGNGANSFGENLMGTASGSGGRFQVRERFRVTILPSGEPELRNFEFSITRVGA